MRNVHTGSCGVQRLKNTEFIEIRRHRNDTEIRTTDYSLNVQNSSAPFVVWKQPMLKAQLLNVIIWYFWELKIGVEFSIYD